MEVSIQYNKTALQELEGLLKVRKTALPVLKNKETALRREVQKMKAELNKLALMAEESAEKVLSYKGLWEEFDFSLLEVGKATFDTKKIAGVEVSELKTLPINLKNYNLENRPAWIVVALDDLSRNVELLAKRQNLEKMMQRMELARRKTTQKVNLFEKVQIPAYEEAILKIKRYLEDEENIAKAGQKILKKRLLS